MFRLILLGLFLATFSLGCDETTRFVEPYEVVVYVTSGASEREAVRVEVPRNAVVDAPLSVHLPATATGARVSADLAADDSLALLGIVRPSRFDVYDLPRAVALTGADALVDILRGPGGAFQPLLFFSLDSLWTGPRTAAQVTVSAGTQTTQRAAARDEVLVRAAAVFTGEDLAIESETGFSAQIRAEVLGARGETDLVPVLVRRTQPGTLTENPVGLQASVLSRDLSNADRYVLPRGRGPRVLVGDLSDPNLSVSLVLLRDV
ncbi:MAG: hypothetical protein AAF791_09015 [Bacteroidota bacterium]